jgi:hypothetical protein
MTNISPLSLSHPKLRTFLNSQDSSKGPDNITLISMDVTNVASLSWALPVASSMHGVGILTTRMELINKKTLIAMTIFTS